MFGENYNKILVKNEKNYNIKTLENERNYSK